MTKDDLRRVFELARKESAEYIFVKVSIPGCECGEMIINKKENFDFKENFYLTAYNDKLEHNHNNLIRIVNLGYGSLADLSKLY